MTRRVVACVALGALALGACGIGDRQAQADRIEHAGDKLLRTPSVNATIEATVAIVKSDKPIAPGAPKLAPEHVAAVGAVINAPKNTAAIGTNSANGQNVIVFADDTIFQRIALKATAVAGSRLTAVVPSNFNALAAAMTNQLTPVATVPTVLTTTTSSTTTSTTAAPKVLRRRVQIVREWAAFDYAAIKDRDRTKHAGSLAINPVDLLRLSKGVLAGSVKRRGADGDLVRYDANVSRDKAERKLTEDERKILDKEFVANAITRKVFPAKFWLDSSGALARLQVKLRQQLTNVDRGDLTITLDLAPAPAEVAIKKPGRQRTVSVRTLGELATSVTGS